MFLCLDIKEMWIMLLFLMIWLPLLDVNISHNSFLFLQDLIFIEVIPLAQWR